jgi:hypothetical protein
MLSFSGLLSISIFLVIFKVSNGLFSVQWESEYWTFKYSRPPNTEPSDIRMVIFRTLFITGFQMVAAILFLPFEIRTGYFLNSLDRFGMNKIFFMTIYK